MTTTRYILGLALALALLIGVRLPFLRCEPFIPGTPLLFDEKDYLQGARSLAMGDTIADTAEAWIRAPATAWLLLTLTRVRGLPVELVGCDFQILQSALWGGLLVLVASITAALFDRRAALIGATLVALLPVGVSVTLMLHSDTLFCVWLAGAVAALLAYARRPHPGWLVAAGLATGAGVLTRSPMVPLIPVLALWAAASEMIKQKTESGKPLSVFRVQLSGLRRGLLSAALFLIVTLLVVAPWAVRNYQLYGGLIFSDTTGAVTLLDNNSTEFHKNYDAIRAASPNPVGRQRYAMARAWQVIGADPLRFMGKFVYTSLLAWSPETFKRTWSFWIGLLEQPRTAALFAHLAVLMWVTIPLVLLGMLFAPRSAPGAASYRATMVVLAICYTLMIGATHFEERYRMPFLLLWLPYAGWCLAHPRALLAALGRPAGLVACALIGLLALSSIPLLWPLEWNNARALALHARGLVRANTNDLVGALDDQRGAAALQPELREARVAQAQLLALQGDAASAEQVLRSALQRQRLDGDPVPADATVALQQLLRAQRRVAESDALDAALAPPARRRAEDLAWRHGATPGPTLQLGADDLGLVRGFYTVGADRSFRWSSPEARILLAGEGDYVCLRLAATRPPDVPAPLVTLVARREGRTPVTLGQLHPPRQGWAWLCAPLNETRSAVSPTSPLEVRLSAPGYIPYLHDVPGDARDLGVAVAEVALRDGPLAIDRASGLLLDQVATPVGGQPVGPIQLLGLSGSARGRPGTVVPITLWWRGEQSPPDGVFTFLHVLDNNDQTVASYNAPLAPDQRRKPWVIDEPLIDQVAVPLPANLAPGRYRLIGGAFNPSSGAQLTRADLGFLVVE
jgi:hypothetical protein